MYFRDAELISIIVPAYNCEQFIDNCIKSILSQTHSNLELIVVNDGSTDNTKNIISKYAECDKRLILVNKENGGVSSARNAGLAIAKGEYVSFVDADDYLSPDFIQYMIELVHKNDSDFGVCLNCITELNQKKPKVVEQLLNNDDGVSLLLSFRLFVGCWNKIFKNAFLKKNKVFFNEKLFYGEGLNFITTCAKLSNHISTSTAAKYFYRKNNLASATTKFNVSKIENGELSLQLIKENNLISKRNLEWWNIHSCFFYLSGFVSIISTKQKKELNTYYKKYRKLFKSFAGKVLLYKQLSIYRKMIVVAGLICPCLLAFLDKKRKKRIIRKSVK